MRSRFFPPPSPWGSTETLGVGRGMARTRGGMAPSLGRAVSRWNPFGTPNRKGRPHRAAFLIVKQRITGKAITRSRNR